MEKKDFIKLGIAYFLVFFLALYSDLQGGVLKDGIMISREEAGGDVVSVDLLLDVGEEIDDQELELEVLPTQITKEEAEGFFEETIKQIEADFKEIERQVSVNTSYVDGFVEADWSFSSAGIVGSDGSVDLEQISTEGEIVVANVILECGAYEKIYSFPFKIPYPQWTKLELLQQELSDFLEQEQAKEGENIFYLPQELGGLPVKWQEKKDFLCIKILVLEVISIVLIFFGKKKEQETLLQKKRYERELQYPELLNQLLILMEAGMTTRQAWHRMAYQYQEKRRKDLVEESEVYVAIVQMDRRLAEGENERNAYESFLSQMDSMSYRRLMRLLISNLEKGSRDICQQLSVEAKQAYEQRLLLAKKLGEEASTKMLVPMMLMMVLVMVIIMAPAMMSFGF